MKTKLTILITLLVLTLLPALAQTADQDIATGQSELGPAADNLTGANTNFAAAVALQPTNETGNVLWAATRLLTLPQTTAGNTFLNNIGFTLGSRDFYNWNARPPKDVNGNVIFPAGLNSSTAAAFILTTGVPTLQACDTNLSVITDPTFTLFLPAAETTGAEDVTLDYGDIQMLRALVEVGEFFGYTVNAQNFNTVVPTVESMLENNTLTLQSAFSSFPSLLTLSSPANLTLSKAALTNAIAHYFAASDYIRNVRSPSFTGLFNLSPNDTNEEAEFRTDLTNFLASLQGPAIIDAKQPSLVINSSNYFSGAKSLRSLTPQFNGNQYVINTMPDYTFGGILSGVPAYQTEALLRKELPEFTGIYIGDNNQFYNTGNGYAVSDSNGNFNGSFAVFVGANNQATLVGNDDGDGVDDGSDFGFYVQFTVSGQGDWGFTNGTISGSGKIDKNGNFTGEIDSPDVSVFLNAAVQSPYGSFQGLAGLYSGPFTGNHSGTAHVILAADGELFLVPVESNGQIANGGSTTVDSNNHLDFISISGTEVTGTVNNLATPTITGNDTDTGNNVGTFSLTRIAQIAFDKPPIIVAAPVNRNVEAGSNAVFTVTASGSAPLTYQWSVNDTNIFNATNSTLVVSNCTLDLNGNRYTVTLNNVVGSTNAVADLAVGDFISPTIIITNLSAGLQVSNGNFVAMGKAWDNASVTNVSYNLNSAGWLTASVTAGASTNWSSAPLGLTPGPNTLSVFAQDENGNDSITDTVNFIYVQSAPLTVSTNSFGWGTLNPNYSGTPLQIAKSYSITATALPGFAFTNWTGGTGGPPTVLANKATITFSMQQNLQLTANFVDITKPTLIITNLVAGQSISNGAFTVMGRSWDNVAIASVSYNLDNTVWQTATPGLVLSNWSAVLPLNPGPNTISVYVQDSSGNVSLTNTVAFNYVVSTPLTVLTNNVGWGTLSPNLSGALLAVNKSYSITATAAAGFAFTNWTGGTTNTALTLLTNKTTVMFLMQTDQIVQANFIDITKPSVIITNLVSGQLLSNATFTVMGRSWDNVAIASVSYNLDGNGWLTATQGLVSSNWSAALPLNAGTNTLSVYAQDSSGNVSPTNSLSFQYVVTTPLVVVTNNPGWGTLSPSYNGTNLQIGRNYSITATALPGFAFTNWTGGTNGLVFLTNKAAVTFMMESNLELSANFVDITKPTLIITNLVAGQSISNGAFTVMGRSWDNVAIASVSYNLDNTVWQTATPGLVLSNWSAVLPLNPGPNTISVYVQDSSGNVSLTNTVAFNYVVSTPLTVLTNNVGWGTLSPNLSGSLLAVNKSYSITATAAAGFAFTNWTGGTTNTALTLLTNKATVTFLMQTDQIVQANFIDITKPGVILTNITAGMLISNSSSYTAMGRSWDNVGVTNIFYNFNSNGWLSVMPSGSATNWSVPLTLNAGTNTLAVYAQDTSGNVSPTNNVSFQYVVTTPLIVTTNSFGWGTLSPNYNGQNLQIGRNYSITATALPGFVFSNWTGDPLPIVVLTNGPTVTFKMEPSLELSANFVDITKPTFLITNLIAGQSISNADFAAMGRSWDNVGVSNIFYNFNSNGWQSVMPSGTGTNWTTGTLGVTPGPNTISVYAQDGSGNVSPTNKVAFTYVVSTPLTVLTNNVGWGTLSPNLSGSLLAVNKSYSITATAAAGFAFTNWTGGTTNTALTLLTNKATVTFLMQTDQIVQANFIDITKPGVILTNITAGMLISNSSSYTAMGRSWDNVGVTNIFYNFNSNGWLSVMPSGSATNWSVPLTLNAGTNTLAVYAQDTSGNVSPTNNVSFQYVVTTPLIVTTNSFGWGTLSPNYNGQNLQIGRNYSITATALPGFVFSNWTGDPLPIVVLTNGPTVTFKMEPSLELFANFRDTIKPSVIITNITSGMVVTNIDFTAKGRSWDNSAVANVFYNFNSNGWQTATPGIVSSNWSAALILNPGSNTLAVYAQDTGGNVSPTNTVAFKSLGYFTLADYYPLPLNAQWTYGGTNAAGQDEDLLLQVLNTDFNLTLYTGGNPAQTYQTNSVEISERFLDPDTVTFTGSGNVFDYAGPLVGMYGDDLFASDGSTNDSFRVDRGIIFPALMTVGTSVTNSGAAYQAGTNVGTYTVVLQLLAHTNLDVFAGNFSDVLYLRQTMTLTGQPVEVDDYWWARSVGLILQQGVSGNDALIYRYLASSTLLAGPSVVAAPATVVPPVETKTSARPSITVQTASPGGPLVFNLTGPTGQTVVVEGSADLVHWQSLETNTFKGGSIYFSDSQGTNYPARFYRIHSP